MYAACKHGRLNCIVTELIALTFCIITLSTVIGYVGSRLNAGNIQYLEFSICEYACRFSKRLRIPRFCDRNNSLLSWALLPSFMLSYKNSYFLPQAKIIFFWQTMLQNIQIKLTTSSPHVQSQYYNFKKSHSSQELSLKPHETVGTANFNFGDNFDCLWGDKLELCRIYNCRLITKVTSDFKI